MIQGNAANERTQMETQVWRTQKTTIFNYYYNSLQYILKVFLLYFFLGGEGLVLYFESTFSMTEINNHDIFMHELFIPLFLL